MTSQTEDNVRTGISVTFLRLIPSQDMCALPQVGSSPAPGLNRRTCRTHCPPATKSPLSVSMLAGHQASRWGVYHWTRAVLCSLRHDAWSKLSATRQADMLIHMLSLPAVIWQEWGERFTKNFLVMMPKWTIIGPMPSATEHTIDSCLLRSSVWQVQDGRIP